MEVMSEGCHFFPKHPEKNIKYYRHILIQEGSAKVEDIMNKENPSVVLYHKFIISGFINCKDWGQHPSLLKTLTSIKTFTGSDLHYSYYDYIDAFEKVLFYQNKKFDHSWFLMFVESSPAQYQHGSLSGGKCLDQYPDLSRTSTGCPQVHEDFPPLVQRNIAPVTRSQSSLDSIQIAEKSSKELKDLAQQLLLQLEELQSQEKGSLASSEASANFDPNNHLFQDSQDPNDAYRLDSE
ncbi:hypothetical protein SO802_020416 [Lithocarpus litseifolius]|uniref:Uncharacterized protein n=1 Tax=Lithocarpus litseifolius TaxID=425828 RepID=A0AAW2CH62_9ROSI